MTASSTRRTTAARSRFAAVGSIAVAGALLLAGCGDQTKDSGDGGTKESASSSKAPLFDKLPAGIQKAGVIKAGTNAEYAPMEYQEGGKIVGVDIDIANALGEK